MSQNYTPLGGNSELIRVPGYGALLLAGTAPPADGLLGYAKGCLFLHTDAADINDSLYINVGSGTSANFDVSDISALTGVTAGTVTASKGVIAGAGKGLLDLGPTVLGHTAQVALANGDGSTALTSNFQVLGTTKATASMLIGCFSTTDTSAVAPTLHLFKSGNGTLGTKTTAVASGEVLGEVLFSGTDGTDGLSSAGRIQCVVDATVGTGDMPGRLVFSTTLDGGEVLTEAMRIDSSQRVVMGGAAATTISDGDGTTACIPSLQRLGTTKATASLLLASYNTTNDTTVAPSLDFLKSGNGTIATNTTAVAADEVLGEINFFGTDGTDGKSAAARIACLVDTGKTVGTGDMPGQLVLSTTADGGETLTAALTIDSAQTVTVSNGLVIQSDTSSSITGARTITRADSGGCFKVAKTSAYEITLPTPAQGLHFKFMVLDTGANIVTITNGSAHLKGCVSINNVSTAMTGTTLSLASAGSVGDWVEFHGIDATNYLVTGACIAAADISIA